MSEKRKITRDDIRVEPTKAVSRSNNFVTLASDYAKCTINPNNQMCTFTFFQSHPIPKFERKGLTLDSIEEEMILEVKMPLRNAFGIAVYLTSILEELQKNPNQKGTFFGPIAIRMKKKDEK